LSVQTIAIYRSLINRAYALLEGCRRPLTSQDIEILVQKLKERHNKPTSISIYLRSLKTFFEWSVKQGHLTKNPVGKMSDYFRMQLTVINSLSLVSVQAVLDAIRTNNRNVERNMAIVKLMMDTGIRPGELLSLTMDNLDMRLYRVNVNGKTGERLLPFTSMTKRAIQDYLDVRVAPLGEEYVFLQKESQPMTKQALKSVFRYAQKKTGIPRLYPYLMRHTSATNYLREGADLETVRMMLGHTTYAITQRYLSLNTTDLARVQRRCSPVNKLR
jgi:integrase/recombinase XerD